MLLGFGASSLFERRELLADRLKVWSVALIFAFLLLRGFDVYGDPNPWYWQSGVLRTVMDFLNTTKYPPSLDYLLMTLGPAALVCAGMESRRGRFKDILVTFGRVPFAFYVMHFFLIHALSVLCGVLQGFPAENFFTVYFFYPKGYGLPLWGVYLVWILVLVMSWPWVRFMAELKSRSRAWWLSYV